MKPPRKKKKKQSKNQRQQTTDSGDERHDSIDCGNEETSDGYDSESDGSIGSLVDFIDNDELCILEASEDYTDEDEIQEDTQHIETGKKNTTEQLNVNDDETLLDPVIAGSNNHSEDLSSDDDELNTTVTELVREANQYISTGSYTN